MRSEASEDLLSDVNGTVFMNPDRGLLNTQVGYGGGVLGGEVHGVVCKGATEESCVINPRSGHTPCCTPLLCYQPPIHDSIILGPLFLPITGIPPSIQAFLAPENGMQSVSGGILSDEVGVVAHMGS